MRLQNTIAIALLIIPKLVFGANWYVRPGGAGSHTGADWNNAWDAGSIGWSSVSAGDTIWMAGGTYSSTMVPGKSGTSSSFINVKRVTSGDSVPVAAAGWSSSFDSHVTIATSTTCINWSAGSQVGSYIAIDGRTKYGIELSAPDYNFEAGGAVVFTGGNFIHDIIITNVDMHGPGTGTFANNLAPFNANSTGGVSASNVLTIDCLIHDSVNLCRMRYATNMTFQRVHFYNSNGSGQHPDMFDILGSGYMHFTQCEFNNWAVEGFMIWSTLSHDFYIDNCLIHDPIGGTSATFLWSANQSQGPVYLYNNTFVNVGNITSSQANQYPFTGGQARNNIYWSSSWYGSFVLTDSDYDFSDISIPGANSISSGSNPFVNYAGGDYSIIGTVSASYPRNKGVTLSSTYQTDFAGNTHGADGTWDIGAYEYAACDPCITGQPSSQTVNCGSTATWTVTATGNTTLSYQWYKNGSAVSGATQSTYTTPATVGTDNSSSWYCAVTDTAGTVDSSTAVLSIELILVQPVNQSVTVGQNATFSVTATACVTSYQWNRNGTSISGATQSSYTEVNCQLSQNGNAYTCNVGTTGESETSGTGVLTVNPVGGITNFYASPSGFSGNTGLSTSSPWDVATAISNVGNSNIINFMDGDYTPADCPGNNTITNYWVTLKAINKWQPRFINLASDGTGGVFRNLTGGAGDGLLVDGLQFSNCQFYPILIRKQGTTNVTIRNNWIHNTGQTWTSVAGGQSGIEVYPSQAWLIERNLLEYNGTNGANAGFNHGLYLAGTNGIARDNVIRYNGGLGISVDGHTGNLDVNNQFYCNLIYSNLDASDATYTGQQLSIYNDGYSTGGPYTNYIFCNTIISQGTTPIFLQGSIDAITNNIIACGATGSGHDGIGRFASDTSATWVDYSLRNVAFQFTGTHDVVSSSYGFLNTGKGLYWLTSGSAARSAALSGVFPPSDFFGNPISSVSDIGAFQYSATYATDTRTLDPSPVAGADYWSALSLNTLSHSISGQIKFSGNIVLK